MNHMAAMFFGRPMEAVLGRRPEEWFGPADAAALRADLQAAQQRTEVLRRELPRPVRSGSDEDAIEQRTWDVRIVSLQTDQGDGPTEGDGAAHLLLVASDVTEQRAAEQARFDAAVSQREMLVKEVHHRIKNNLQGVAGLLQQTAARRPEVAVLIGEAVGQVQAIAQVHGLQVGASGPLRVKPLVDAIAASVQRTFGRPITVSVQGTPAHRFALPEAESIPIALTVNELLTNAIKHGAPGEIRCVLHFDEARLAIQILSPGQLRPGFSLAQVPPGVSGLGLVRALLPRRTATLTLQQAGVQVEAKVVLVPPSIHLLEPL
jgi:two-component sensor histidine kinase